jgi:hypothetical protein
MNISRKTLHKFSPHIPQKTSKGNKSRSTNDEILHNFLQEKAVEATKQKATKRKKPKPEEQEVMPQRQHCPLEKRRGDWNP